MSVLAIFGGSFLEPNAGQWLFGAGIGTNIGASIIWGFLAGLLGMWVARHLKAIWGKVREHHRVMEAHADHQTKLIEEQHFLAHHGVPHPRVQERLDRGEHRTPTLTIPPTPEEISVAPTPTLLQIPSKWSLIGGLVMGVLIVLNQAVFSFIEPWHSYITVVLVFLGSFGVSPLVGPAFRAAIHLSTAWALAISSALGAVAVAVTTLDWSQGVKSIVLCVIAVATGLGFAPTTTAIEAAQQKELARKGLGRW